jgi:hypothetical protein
MMLAVQLLTPKAAVLCPQERSPRSPTLFVRTAMAFRGHVLAILHGPERYRFDSVLLVELMGCNSWELWSSRAHDVEAKNTSQTPTGTKRSKGHTGGRYCFLFLATH